MDDITGLGKLAEGLSKPAVKLIEVVSSGIGALYEPVAIRRRADAEAQKLLKLETAKAEAEELRKDIQLTRHLGRLQSFVKSDPGLVERAKARLATQEIQGQLNVEAIADGAMKHLPQDVSEDPVSDDWRQRFFKLAADVSDEDMRELWSKVLAGEVSQPKTYSPRTLEILHGITANEAALFTRFASLCPLSPFHGALVLNDWNYGLAPYGVTFEDVLLLREIGLVTPDVVAMRYETGQITPLIFNAQHGWWLKPKSRIDTRYLALTTSGVQLARLAPRTPSDDFIGQVVAKLHEQGYELKRLDQGPPKTG
jgi:hypothetical protein